MKRTQRGTKDKRRAIKQNRPDWRNTPKGYVRTKKEDKED